MSGGAAELSDFAAGDNVPTITVRAENGTTKTCTLTVMRLSTGVSSRATLGVLVGFADEGRGYDRRRADDGR